MPRYHCLDTEVQLCTLGSPCGQSTVVQSFVPARKTSAAADASVFSEECLQYNHDRSIMVKRLKEEYFKGREGLNFLGRDVPFFLVHAGNDMSDDPHRAKQWTGTNNLLNQDQKVHFESSDELTTTPLSKGSPTTARAMLDIQYQSLMDGERRQHQHDSSKTYLFSDGSRLPSLSTTEFLSPHASNLRSSETNKEMAGEPFDSFVTPNNSEWTTKSLGKSCSSSKLRAVTKPVQVVVKLSEKSFLGPILGNKSNHYDICVNLFYNGEFSASQLVEYSDWVNDKSKGYLHFGGRRVDICHELPWILTNKTKDHHHKSPTLLAPLERWNMLTDILMLEANKWGRDERGYRNLTGEYLELLSKTNMPSELYSPTVCTGIGFGVIDIVITLGRVLEHNAVKEIDSPRRNLPLRKSQNAGLSVGAGCETRIATQVVATVTDSSKDFPEIQFLNCKNEEGIVRPSSVTEISRAITAPSYHGDKINSDASSVATTMSGSISYTTGHRTVARVPTSTSARIPAALALVPTSRAHHPNQPEKVPQKTYRGSEPSLPSSQRMKPKKSANIFEELPFDLNTAAYMSTRARRNASMPLAETAPKSGLGGSLKRKRSVNQDKSALLNAESLGTTVVGAPLAPKKNRLSGHITTVPDGRLKKKIRSTNYNPKLSNRPQNLRRKNSAGEWIIPPCRKNSSGEWETSPKGSQVKAAGSGPVTDEATTPENEKNFQQVFTDPVQKTNRNMVIGPNTPNKASVNNVKITLKEFEHPSTSTDNIKDVIFKGSAIENDTEIVNSGRSNEVAITRIDDNFTSPPTESAFRHTKFPHNPVKGTEAREILPTSPTAANATVFDDCLWKEKKNAMFFVNKNTSRKRTLPMKFFKAKINSAEEIIGDEGSKKRWLVQHCVTPECIPSPAIEQNLTSHSLFEKPKQTISAFTTIPEVDNSTGLLRELKATKSRRNSGTGNTADTNVSKNSVIATLRGNSVENVPKLQFSAITEPRPRFVIPKHNSRLLKLVKTQPITTMTASIEQETQDKSVSLDGSIMIPPHEDSLRGFDADAQCARRGNAPKSVQDGTAGSKRSFRQRTVGSTELKALLESHDIQNVANTSLGDHLEATDHCQPMTRASRKAISYKPREPIDANENVADTLASSDQPIGQVPRKRKSSSELFGTTTAAANVPKITKATNTCISKVVDCAAYNKRDFVVPILQLKKPPLKTHRSDTADQTVMATMAFDPNLLRASDTGLSDITQAEIAREVIAGPLRPLESAKVTMLYPGGHSVQRADKLEAVIDNLDSDLIDNLTSSQLNINGGTLHIKASNLLNVEETAEEVDMGHLRRTNTETNNAATNLGDLKVHASTQHAFQNPVAVYSDRDKTPNSETNGKRMTDMHESQGQNAPTSPKRAGDVNFWRPGSFCDGSALAYAKNESWDNMARNPVSYQACRRVEPQKEGYFEAFDVLMGVRYVVVGCAEVEEG